MKPFRILLAATAAISPFIASGALAQSTGTIDFEGEEAIVITGTRVSGIEGVQLPDTTKAKGVLTQDIIARGTAGNSILDTINLVPGVSFQNNDPFGSAGGQLNIRGFGADRISLTFDGVPLNDTGNYAIYSNQQLDPELIEQVNVNLGSTDVDSPTAAASGGTVNYRTRQPYEDFGLTAVVAGGSYDFYRLFGAIDTGELTSWGTRAFFSASTAGNRNVYNNLGKIYKQQYNGRIYQPIGSNGDFVSISGHYNQNRNNFFGSLPLRVDTDTGRVVGPNSSDRYPITADERAYTLPECNINNVTVRPGVADPATTCGATFDYRYNPSNTGNIRVNSKFTLADGLVLTVDPSFQYVKANGGGTVSAREAYFDLDPASTPTTGTGAVPTANQCTTVLTGVGLNCVAGYFGGAPYFGRDLNGDGDLRDQVLVVAPSQTQTRRYGVIASLRYEIDPNNSVRVAYTLDHGKHRQTGEVGFLQTNGFAIDPFPVNDPAMTSTGSILEKRDRKSIAILNQVSGEYRGRFFDNSLTVTLGLRAPFFTRDLTNNCFTSSAGGFVECFGLNTPVPSSAATLRPTWAPPQNRVLKYDKLLPNVGFNYRFTPSTSIFANYSKGLQVPGTDPLYNSFFFPVGTAGARPDPETTDSFDFGGRYLSRNFQAQGTVWFTKYDNRLASAYDPDLNQTVYRNLGRVDKWGADGSVSWKPFKVLTLYGFGSYLKSEIKDDIQIGVFNGTALYANTAGKRESGAPVFTLGGRVQLEIDELQVGFQGKRTGKRYVYDTNEPVLRRDLIGTGASRTYVDREIFGAVAPGYTLFDLDIRYSLAQVGLNKSWIQLNASNLFDKFYVGGFGGGLNQSITRCSTVNTGTSGTFCPAAGTVTSYGSPPFVQIGAPRAVTLSFHMQM